MNAGLYYTVLTFFIVAHLNDNDNVLISGLAPGVW